MEVGGQKTAKNLSTQFVNDPLPANTAIKHSIMKVSIAVAQGTWGRPCPPNPIFTTDKTDVAPNEQNICINNY